MIYKVEITETLSRIVEVDAESREDAEIKVQEEYRNEHIVLDAEDMKESTIKIYDEEQPERKPGEWYQDDYIGGIIREDGTIMVYEECGLTDADTDRYAVEVQNGDGYYGSDGKYRSYSKDSWER